MNNADYLEPILDSLLEREGGYVNHAHDRGGPTNMGITLRTLNEYRGGHVTVSDVQNLTRDEAIEIYTQVYWKDSGLCELEVGPVVDELLLDMAVHHGPRNAIRMLQRALRVTDDGILGPVTQAAASAKSPRKLMAGLMAERLVFFGRLITRDPKQASFAHGWMIRMKPFIEDIAA